MATLERWPPVYDADDLREQIRRLVQTGMLDANFFAAEPDLPLCQGDIFHLLSPLPAISDDGEPAIHGEFEYWMAIGNTCDSTRSLDEVPWTQLIPLEDLGPEDSLTPDELQRLRSYQPYRSFYIPPWTEVLQGRIFQADFTRPVTAHKKAVLDVAQRQARLSRWGWILFHSCLIRFLARDDGRFDP